MNKLSPSQWKARIEANAEHALHMVVDEYQRRLYWVIRRIVLTHQNADDVLQNTFIKTWQNLSSYNGTSNMYSWLYRIATNEALNFLKKEKKVAADAGMDMALAVEWLKADAQFDGDEAMLVFQSAIATLPLSQKTVFNMKYFDQLKYEEIAEITGTSIGGLKANYHHAVQKIKRYINPD